jgi:hypothetical protein
LLPTSDARYAGAQKLCKIPLAQAQSGPHLANLFGLQNRTDRREARHAQARFLSPAILHRFVETGHHVFEKFSLHFRASLKPKIASFSNFFCGAVRSACSFLLKIISKKICPSLSMSLARALEAGYVVNVPAPEGGDQNGSIEELFHPVFHLGALFGNGAVAIFAFAVD